MQKSERIKIAKEILALIEKGEPYLGEESWESDIGRFTDQERFELEKKLLFLERPQLIALSADLPNPGDYYATDIAGLPILIMRNKDGKAQAFLNACRHRGIKLAEGCGHAQRLAARAAHSGRLAQRPFARPSPARLKRRRGFFCRSGSASNASCAPTGCAHLSCASQP